MLVDSGWKPAARYTFRDGMLSVSKLTLKRRVPRALRRSSPHARTVSAGARRGLLVTAYALGMIVGVARYDRTAAMI